MFCSIRFRPITSVLLSLRLVGVGQSTSLFTWGQFNKPVHVFAGKGTQPPEDGLKAHVACFPRTVYGHWCLVPAPGLWNTSLWGQEGILPWREDLGRALTTKPVLSWESRRILEAGRPALPSWLISPQGHWPFCCTASYILPAPGHSRGWGRQDPVLPGLRTQEEKRWEAPCQRTVWNLPFVQIPPVCNALVRLWPALKE